jgi:hypothetical protein
MAVASTVAAPLWGATSGKSGRKPVVRLLTVQAAGDHVGRVHIVQSP